MTLTATQKLKLYSLHAQQASKDNASSWEQDKLEDSDFYPYTASLGLGVLEAQAVAFDAWRNFDALMKEAA